MDCRTRSKPPAPPFPDLPERLAAFDHLALRRLNSELTVHVLFGDRPGWCLCDRCLFDQAHTR